jgi:hypothetical protein
VKLRPIHYIFVLLAAGIIYGMGRHAANLSAELANWKKAAQDALQARSAYLGQIDSLKGVEARLRARQGFLQADLARLGNTAEALARHVDSLDRSSASVDSLLPAYRRALLGSQAAYVVCRGALAVSDSGWGACQQRASLAEQRAARLDSLLRQGMKVQTCRIGFLPCPSRAVVFAGGLLGGFLLGRH